MGHLSPIQWHDWSLNFKVLKVFSFNRHNDFEKIIGNKIHSPDHYHYALLDYYVANLKKKKKKCVAVITRTHLGFELGFFQFGKVIGITLNDSTKLLFPIYSVTISKQLSHQQD